MTVKSRFILLISLFLSVVPVFSQVSGDTIVLTLPEAEKMFLEGNLSILAKKYDIDAAKASVIQAKLWNNPVVQIEQNVYNPVVRQYVGISPSGETAIQVQHLIYIAGKRNKRIAIEKTNLQIAEYEFYDLLRTLKSELRSTFFDLYFEYRALQVYDREINALRRLSEAISAQYEKGNASLRETIRIRALLLDVEKDRIDVLSSINRESADINVLLNNSSMRFIIPSADSSSWKNLSAGGLTLQQFSDSAFANRYDLKIYAADTLLKQQEYVLQKAMAYPDIYWGTAFDRNGNFIHNYNAATLQLEIPLFNRNQGNIKAAQSHMAESSALYRQFTSRLGNDVMTAYRQVAETEKLYRIFDARLTAEMDTLAGGIIENFAKKNISMLEFIDYYQTYKSTMEEYYQLWNAHMKNLDRINYVSGTELFRF